MEPWSTHARDRSRGTGPEQEATGSCALRQCGSEPSPAAAGGHGRGGVHFPHDHQPSLLSRHWSGPGAAQERSWSQCSSSSSSEEGGPKLKGRPNPAAVRSQHRWRVMLLLACGVLASGAVFFQSTHHLSGDHLSSSHWPGGDDRHEGGSLITTTAGGMQVQSGWQAQGVQGGVAFSGQGWLSKVRHDGSRELRVVVGVVPRIKASSQLSSSSGRDATSSETSKASTRDSHPAGSAGASPQAANASATTSQPEPLSEEEQALKLLSLDTLLDFLAVMFMDVLPALDQDQRWGQGWMCPVHACSLCMVTEQCFQGQVCRTLIHD
jgi:hypothetical protein